MSDGIREAIVNLEKRLDQRIVGVEQRMTALDDKMSRYFTWLVGLQVTTLVAVVAALLARP